MKKILSPVIVIALIVALITSVYAADPGQTDVLCQADFDTYSDAYVVIDAATGQVLLEQNMHKKEYPASITKIMTIALALERSALSDTLVMSEQAVNSVARSSSHIALSAGEEITVEDAVMAALLPSANDAANGLAEYIGGSIEMFCALMNKTADKAGAVDTNFANANGLEDDNHYTSAYDMAMITKYALTVKNFRKVFGTVAYTMQPTNRQPEQRNFGTQHHMIVYSAYQYKGAWGGKLGWTPQANHTAVTVAKRDGTELICVVMNSKTKWEKYKDTKKLFDYCFDNLEQISVSADVTRSKSIPIIEGRRVVGTARLPEQTQTYALLVPKGVAAERVDVSYTTQVSYGAGDKIEPEACFSIMEEGGSADSIFLAPLECEVVMDEDQPEGTVLSATQTMANRNKPGADVVNDEPNGFFTIAAVLGAIGGLFGLFLLMRLLVQRWYREKRRRARVMRHRRY
ncbi:MAG: D-alanyl-D-alanine carboxypeptidase family protein [Acetanaerobacterium sp.]